MTIAATNPPSHRAWGKTWLGVLAGGMLVVSMVLIFCVAPREATMGDAQRLVYVHVAMAWNCLAGCIAMGAMAAAYLVTRRPAYDEWSQASAEIAWLTATVTLVTGSVWAHEAWNTWWTWEPRLTATLILWTMLAGYFLIRSSIEDSHRRARVAAMLALVALADVPLVVMATRWFRGMHPVSPEMEPTMRLTLVWGALSFTIWLAWLAGFRKRQLEQAEQLGQMIRTMEETS